MNLRLPSGAIVEVEHPRLRAVIPTEYDVVTTAETLVEAVWAHDMDADRLTDGDRAFLVEWCIEGLAEDEEAITIATLGERYGRTPAQRLHITDESLALDCDAAFTNAMDEAREAARERATRR
jgi:hypothetical protein